MKIKKFTLCIIFFLCACSTDNEPRLSACLTLEEKKDLDYLFRFLIFENYGGFVLFGSKPLCEMSVQDINYTLSHEELQKCIDAMSESEREQFKSVYKKAKKRMRKTPQLTRNPYQGVLALEKVLKTFKMKNYILRITPGFAPDSQRITDYDLMFINIQQTALVLAEHYSIFKEASGMDFHPLQAVFELQNLDSVFWKNIFSLKNHVAKGLLFGFGLKNSIFGSWKFSCSNGQLDLPSNHYKESIVDYLKHLPFDASRQDAKSPFCAEPLTHVVIPFFRVIQGDDVVKKYTKEKKTIESIYRGRDLVEVTLRQLAGKELQK